MTWVRKKRARKKLVEFTAEFVTELGKERLEQSETRRGRVEKNLRILFEFGRNGVGEPNEVERALEHVLAVFYTRAADGALTLSDSRFRVGDLEKPLNVLTCAAVGRLRLVRGESVSTAELAALGSCTPANVRVYLAEGVLAYEEGGRGSVQAASARRWLHDRGVAGF